MGFGTHVKSLMYNFKDSHYDSFSREFGSQVVTIRHAKLHPQGKWQLMEFPSTQVSLFEPWCTYNLAVCCLTYLFCQLFVSLF